MIVSQQSKLIEGNQKLKKKQLRACPPKLSTFFPLKLDKTDSKVYMCRERARIVRKQQKRKKKRAVKERVVLSDILKYYKAQIIKMA